jgi:hypothetical protein
MAPYWEDDDVPMGTPPSTPWGDAHAYPGSPVHMDQGDSDAEQETSLREQALQRERDQALQRERSRQQQQQQVPATVKAPAPQYADETPEGDWTPPPTAEAKQEADNDAGNDSEDRLDEPWMLPGGKVPSAGGRSLDHLQYNLVYV